MDVSVIICTYNPQADHMRRLLEALQAQTLPREQWELLLVDNNSEPPLAKTCDLSWHPNGRHIVETMQGVMPARMRGLDESGSDILVYLDGDNVLRPGFLAEALRIGREWPMLGAWGGSIIAEYEGGPPADNWKRNIFEEKITRETWSNNYDRNTVPRGGGLCIRRKVAECYGEKARKDKMRLTLDRTGKALTSGADIDMAYVACDMGLGIGMFPSLELLHLIPARRLEDAYLYRLREGFGHGNTLIDAFRGKVPPYRPLTDPFADFLRRLRHPLNEWSWHVAFDSGRRRALREFREAKRNSSQ